MISIHSKDHAAAEDAPLAVEAGLAAALHVAGGREDQRTEVTEDHVPEVVPDLVNEGESLVPTAGPGSILVQNPILISDSYYYILKNVLLIPRSRSRDRRRSYRSRSRSRSRDRYR